MEKNVVVMGGGPAGLAAAYKLSKENIKTHVSEMDSQVGGISKTISYKGFYFDLGGHRFFTKIDEVNELWFEVLGDDFITTPRLSRIFYNGKFFNYPLKPANALFNLGIFKTVKVLASYAWIKINPISEEKTFEQWVSNRFGRELFKIFFKTYTEKVWGIPCSELSAEWAAQRIKGLSLTSAIKNALFKSKDKKIKTLIDEFQYPKYGPGMMYDTMKKKIQEMNNTVSLNEEIIRINHENSKIISVVVKGVDGEKEIKGTDFISTIPITTLVQLMSPSAPKDVLEASKALKYRSLLTIDVILNKENLFPDNWIYIHSPEVKMGRIQNFKNWSKYMVPDPVKSSLGLEYFCDEGDELWNESDDKLIELGKSELEKIGLAKQSDIEDGCVIRVPKAYPVYDGDYRKHLDTIKKYVSGFSNLQLAGRYGMFRYNNMDHSILTGLLAAKNILGENHDIWAVNTEDEYHEEKQNL